MKRDTASLLFYRSDQFSDPIGKLQTLHLISSWCCKLSLLRICGIEAWFYSGLITPFLLYSIHANSSPRQAIKDDQSGP